MPRYTTELVPTMPLPHAPPAPAAPTPAPAPAAGVTAAALARVEAARARADAATPGPWRWSTHFHSKHIDLVGRATHFVMGFKRWGLNGAAPTFRTPDRPLDAGYMRRADVWMEIDPERPHHADHHRLLIHPDADFIAHARADVPLLCDIATAAVRYMARVETRRGRVPWWGTLARNMVGAASVMQCQGCGGHAPSHILEVEDWGDRAWHVDDCPALELDAAIRAAGEAGQ